MSNALAVPGEPQFWPGSLAGDGGSEAGGARVTLHELAFGAGQVNVLTLDWQTLAGFAGGGFVLSVLTSLASDALTSTPGPSLAGEVLEGRHVAHILPVNPPATPR